MRHKQCFLNSIEFNLCCTCLLDAAKKDIVCESFLQQYNNWQKKLANDYEGDWRRWWDEELLKDKNIE